MDHESAVDLYNSLTSDPQTTKLGCVALSHDLPVILEDTTHDYRDDCRAVADFLRVWADGLEKID